MNPSELRYTRYGTAGILAGCSSHGCYVALGVVLGFPELVVSNLIGIGVFLAALGLLRSRRIWSATVVACLWTSLHQVFSSYVLGWGAGFEYYVVIAAAIAFFLPRHLVTSFLLAGATLAIFVGMYWLGQVVPPGRTIPLELHRVLLVSNALLAGGLLAVFAAFYRKGADESDTAYQQEQERSQKLLLNILPAQVASELTAKGTVEPVVHPSVSVMFTDFVDFTARTVSLPPEKLIRLLDESFLVYDGIAARHRLERLKTIGDSYMCVGGMPTANETHAVDSCLAALAIMDHNRLHPYFELRIGINTGPVIAGVVGMTKFSYDVWGTSVNVASRLEGAAQPGTIVLSRSTYEAVREYFVVEPLGRRPAKRDLTLEMFVLQRLKPEYSADAAGVVPNAHLRSWNT